MSVRKSDDFIADVERQYRWYLKNANEDVAERYLTSVETTCRLLGQPRAALPTCACPFTLGP
jgi:plasmid stabilization system protein ParE